MDHATVEQLIQMKSDVFILGSGPAGCSLAAALVRKGIHSVCLLSRGESAHKSFGESVVPLTKNQIISAGFRFNETHQPFQGNCSSWGNELLCFQDFSDKLKGGWKLDKSRFDQDLLEHVRSIGVRVIDDHEFSALKFRQHGWEISLKPSDGCQTPIMECRSDFIVDATGRTNCLASYFGIERRAHDELTCLATWIDEPLSGEHLLREHAYIEAVPNGWWYVNRTAEHKTLVALMTDLSLIQERNLQDKEMFLKLISETKRVHQFAEGLSEDFTIDQFMVNSDRLTRVAGTGWLAVGDAAIGMDPLTSSGIACAFDDAEIASDLIHRWLLYKDDDILRQYYHHIDQSFMRYMTQRHHQYSYELRWQKEPFWSVRQHRIKRDLLIGR